MACMQVPGCHVSSHACLSLCRHDLTAPVLTFKHSRQPDMEQLEIHSKVRPHLEPSAALSNPSFHSRIWYDGSTSRPNAPSPGLSKPIKSPSALVSSNILVEASLRPLNSTLLHSRPRLPRV